MHVTLDGLADGQRELVTVEDRAHRKSLGDVIEGTKAFWAN
jgi:hypothetical protein